ncbi:hypothetical protein lbkm_0820 [Lachnospiraceae bacterium KM106-2]|nr:hypothetical protein lbkm_0820 [Lachnospiraceae bacterium KM106-2]
MVRLLEFLAIVVVSISVMLIHELSKALVYTGLEKGTEGKKRIFHVFQYIDPIGLIFCITCKAGFSKPYGYRIRNKKNACKIGGTGFFILALIALIGILIYRANYRMVNIGLLLAGSDYAAIFLYLLVYYMIFISISMFLVNLFPIYALDMGLIIAGTSSRAFVSTLKNDHLLKIVLFIVLFLQVIEMFTNQIALLFV